MCNFKRSVWNINVCNIETYAALKRAFFNDTQRNGRAGVRQP